MGLVKRFLTTRTLRFWESVPMWTGEGGTRAPLNCFNKDLNKFLNRFYGGILQKGVGCNGPGTPTWSSRRSRENKSLWVTQMLISNSSDIEGDELPGNLIFVAIKVSQLWVDSKTAFPLPMLHLLWIFGLWLYTNLSCNSFTLYHQAWARVFPSPGPGLQTM